MNCKASEAEFQKVRCEQKREDCAICCIYHACAQEWIHREIWRSCSYFNKGRCGFGG